MWFRRKGRNRRHGRDAVLGVKMRAREARRSKLRVIAAAMGVIGGTTFGALVLWQVYRWALVEFVYENEAFAIRRIEIRHEGRLRPEQIRRWADIAPGENLLALDLDRVRHDLELNPWIRWADVQAQRPDCLRLTVWEREPVAQVVVWRFSQAERRAWAETNYLDESGFVLPPLRPEWVRPGEDCDFSHLPRLVGLDEYPVIPGETLQVPAVMAALRLIRAYEESAIYSLVDLERIEVSARSPLQGVLRRGTRIVFGNDDFERQMGRWRSIHEYAGSLGKHLEWLDLSVTNNLPARWRDMTDTDTTPAQPKPKRTPKRHV